VTATKRKFSIHWVTVNQLFFLFHNQVSVQKHENPPPSTLAFRTSERAPLGREGQQMGKGGVGWGFFS
jgi:hypothetical protein